jgi:signal transduction histidine kinase
VVPPSDAAEGGLAVLLKRQRQELIDRWSAGTQRENTAIPVSRAELLDHIPRFVDELIAALHPDAMPLPSLGENAHEHGAQRLSLGFNVAEVVREYGTLHRSIVELAFEAEEPITLRDEKVIARWLNAGIANAVSQYVNDRDAELQRQGAEHMGFIAHEIRNPLSSVTMAFRLLQKGPLASGGRAVELLKRNLQRMLDVIDNALLHASLNMGVELRPEAVALQKLLAELELDYGAEAEAKGIEVVATVPPGLVIQADARLLNSALSNLLKNALKFSKPNTQIQLRARVEDGQVLIEVEDSCGGLPPGSVEELFKPLVQRGKDQTGFGLGLSISQQAAQAHNGRLQVRDLPGKGCVFTLQLPAIETP